MTRRYFALILCAILLSACGWTVNPLPAIPYYPTPSRTPVILQLTPTPRILTPTIALSATIQQVDTPTNTATVTATLFVTPTISSDPELKVEISGCNISLDITHRMGEVTNAYVTISNLGKGTSPTSARRFQQATRPAATRIRANVSHPYRQAIRSR